MATPGRTKSLLTFTNKAAEEMRARVEALLGSTSPHVVSTFHALCAPAAAPRSARHRPVA